MNQLELFASHSHSQTVKTNVTCIVYYSPNDTARLLQFIDSSNVVVVVSRNHSGMVNKNVQLWIILMNFFMVFDAWMLQQLV